MNARWIVGGTVCVVLAATSWMVACVGDAGSTGTGTDAGGVDGGGTADTGPGNTADGSTFDAGTVDSGCGDTKSSADNCGTCGHKCSAGNACFTGRCGNEVVLLGGSASSGDSCALLANGTVWGWGDNLNGDLGVGDKLARNFATKITVDSTGATFDHVVDVGIGFGHACARKDDGSIWCWGQGKDGATGVTVDPLQADVLVPTKVGNLSGYKSLRVSGDTNCGIDANDDVYCWGSNDHLLLGHTSNTNGDIAYPGNGCTGVVQANPFYANATPTKVVGLSNVKALEMGDQHACAVDGAGTVKCWGADDFNQLGDAQNNSGTASSPCGRGITNVIVPNKPIALGGGRLQTCALYGAAQPAKCWGSNQSGQLGIGTTDGGEPANYGASVLGVAATGGNYHLCMLTTAGGVLCSGNNDHNALGSAAPHPSLTPQTVLIGNTPIANVTALTSSFLVSCALRNDNTVWCWGENTAAGDLGGAGGRLGNGDAVAHVGAVKVMGLPQ